LFLKLLYGVISIIKKQ